MYRAIITPTAENHTFEIPQEFYGKKIKLEVSESSDSDPTKTIKTRDARFRAFENLARSIKVGSSKTEKYTREDLYDHLS